MLTCVADYGVLWQLHGTWCNGSVCCLLKPWLCVPLWHLAALLFCTLTAALCALGMAVMSCRGQARPELLLREYDVASVQAVNGAGYTVQQ